jgi:hypothetical protein
MWARGPILLVAFSDGVNQQGTVPSTKILNDLLCHNVWYLRRGSRYLVPGDTTVIFYQSGAGIRGYAKVVSVDDVTNAARWQLEQYGLSHLNVRLGLDEVELFVKPVKISPLVDRLDFVSNKVHWGQSVRTTPRTINDRDFATIKAEAVNTRHRSTKA